MLNPSEKAYCQALSALRRKDYRSAANYFEEASAHFKDNDEFNLLHETTRLLVVVKDELAVAENEEDAMVIEEAFSDGQKTDLYR